jgi:mono/diheme cytochrome c family protein
MTRQSRARWLAFATTALVVLLAALFAGLRNLDPVKRLAVATITAAIETPRDRIDAGRAAFVELGCTVCHAAEGRGNPSLPLDGIGARLTREELQAGAFARGASADALPSGVARIKRSRASDASVDALLDYLQQLR